MKKTCILVLLMTLVLTLAGCGEKEITNGGERVRDERGGNEKTEDDPDVTADGSDEVVEENGDADEYDYPQEIKILSEGDKAPDFTAELSGGGSFTLSDHKDEVVLINFWATWCGPCVREMPAFERLKGDGIEGFDLICINCMDDKATVDSFVADEGYTFNIAYDTDGSIEMYYPTDGIPYTLIVDHGVISAIYVGAMDADYQYKEYKSAIEDALK